MTDPTQPPLLPVSEAAREAELKPCPFCGGPADIITPSFPMAADCDDIFVKCEDCDAMGAQVLFDQDTHDAEDLEDLIDEAVTAWNTRFEARLAGSGEGPLSEAVFAGLDLVVDAQTALAFCNGLRRKRKANTPPSDNGQGLREALDAMIKYYDPHDHLVANGCEHGFKPASSCPNAGCQEADLHRKLNAIDRLSSGTVGEGGE
jgi:Lar family restriction alleviation protein